nr:hypothetical protein [Halalkalibacterium ligniniphilum]
MTLFITDFILLGVFIIGITAFIGVITSTFAKTLFGRKQKDYFYNQSDQVKKGWRQIGGKS